MFEGGGVGRSGRCGIERDRAAGSRPHVGDPQSAFRLGDVPRPQLGREFLDVGGLRRDADFGRHDGPGLGLRHDGLSAHGVVDARNRRRRVRLARRRVALRADVEELSGPRAETGPAHRLRRPRPGAEHAAVCRECRRRMLRGERRQDPLHGRSRLSGEIYPLHRSPGRGFQRSGQGGFHRRLRSGQVGRVACHDLQGSGQQGRRVRLDHVALFRDLYARAAGHPLPSRAGRFESG